MRSIFLLVSLANGLKQPLSTVLGRRCAIGALAVQVALPANGLEREFSNSNVLFKDDFWFKFGKKPAPITSDENLPGSPAFVRVQVRYDAMSKYGPKIRIGLEAFEANDYETVLKSLRPMGLLANQLLASESLTNEVFLARFYINEVYLALTDIDSQQDKSIPLANAKANINAYLILVNRAISAKVGDKFTLLS